MKTKHIYIIALLALITWTMPAKGQELDYPLDTINGQIYYRYTVERSIGLYRISLNFGVTQEEILKANPHLQNQGLRFEEVILIPAKNLSVDTPATQESKDKKRTRMVLFDDDQRLTKKTTVKKPTARKAVKPVVKEQKTIEPAPQELLPVLPVPVDTAIVDTLVQADTLPKIDSTATRVAFLLPLHADAIKREKNMERFYDFYAGALIAIYETQAEGQPLEIFTYDVGKGTDEVAKVMSELSANRVDAIIGPAYSQQVSLAIDSARKDSTWILVPFLPRVNNIEQNPFVIKFNPSPQVEADALAKYLAKRKDSMQCVLLEAKEDEVIPQGITALHQALKKHNVPTSTITLRAILTDSLNGLHPDKENILIFNTEKYNNLNTVIPHLLAACGKYRITLFSHYSWQTEKIILPQLYTSVFAKKCLVPDNYEELYRTYFNHELSSLQPRYDLLGYDLTKHLLQMLIQSQQDSLSNMREVIVNYPWAGTQANIHYQSVGEKGGFENKNVYIIHQ